MVAVVVVKERAYPGAVDAVVDPPEFADGQVYHALDAGLLGDIDLDGHGAVFRVLGVFVALLGRCLGAFFVDVCEDDADGAGFGQGESGFLADAACSLEVVRVTGGNQRM